MAAAPTDLCTLADVKNWLNIGIAAPNTVSDAQLQLLLSNYSQMVARYINRATSPGSFTESYDGNGRNRLWLRRWPVTAVSAVAVNGQAVQQGNGSTGTPGWIPTLWDGVSTPIPEPMITLTPGWSIPGYGFGGAGGCGFPQGSQNVSVTYQAGFTISPTSNVPFDIQQAVLELVGQQWRSRDRIGFKSQTAAQMSTAYQLEMLPMVVQALAPYRRVVPVNQ